MLDKICDWRAGEKAVSIELPFMVDCCWRNALGEVENLGPSSRLDLTTFVTSQHSSSLMPSLSL